MIEGQNNRADGHEDFGCPDDLSTGQHSKADLNAKINAGFISGPASPMRADDWQELHNRTDGRQNS